VAADVLDHKGRRGARLGHAGDVGREQDARVPPEGVVLRRGFLFQDVEDSPREATFIQRPQQVGLDEMAAASGIDEACAARERREGPGV
jgi:hypothetical protein